MRRLIGLGLIVATLWAGAAAAQFLLPFAANPLTPPPVTSGTALSVATSTCLAVATSVCLEVAP